MSPESAHQVTILMSDRGIPRSWRHQHGFSSHTYSWVNAGGEKFWVKYHFRTDQGIENIPESEADEIAGTDKDYHRRDLINAIDKGDHPSWTLYVQVMPFAEAADYRFNPFDLTKVWPKGDYPLIEVGRMTLNRNPENFFAEVEQSTFKPANLVPGTGLSPGQDADGARLQLPRHAPAPRGRQPRAAADQRAATSEVNSYNRDGHMTYRNAGDRPTTRPTPRAARPRSGPSTAPTWAGTSRPPSWPATPTASTPRTTTSSSRARSTTTSWRT